MLLSDILLNFNSPIKEEQAWAVCHQCGKFLKWEIQHNSMKNNYNALLGPKSVVFGRDGNVSIIGTLVKDENEVVKSLGLTLFAALDYGLPEDEEQKLSPNLENLISCMTENLSASDEETDDGYYDGKAHADVGTLDHVIQLCEEHLSSTADADAHYLAVCSALVNEAEELQVFLSKVESANESLQKLSGKTSSPSCTIDDETSNEIRNLNFVGWSLQKLSGKTSSPSCTIDDETSNEIRNLNFVGWAHMWIQVLDELRHGVTKLRKVEKRRKMSIEYELTPYEILMGDIRRMNYTLKKATSNQNLPSVTKKNAHDIILDFIKSRPNLSPAHERVLAPTPPRSKSLHEKLIEQIQGHTAPLKRVDNIDRLKTSKTFDVGNPSTCDDGMTSSVSRRRLLKPSIDELEIDDDVMSESDDEVVEESMELYMSDSDFNNSSIQQVNNYSNVSSLRSSGTSGISSSTSDDVEIPRHRPRAIRFCDSVRRKRLLPLELPPSPIKSPDNDQPCEPKSSIMESIFSSFRKPSGLRRSQSVAIRTSSISPADVKRQRWRDERRKVNGRDFPLPERSSSPSHEIQLRRTYSERRCHKKESHRHPLECLSLTVEEVMHIRQVLSRAQLEKFQSSKELYTALKNEKICFNCRSKKFGLFLWPYACHICKRKVCSKCIKRIRAPTDKYLQTPLSTLNPSPIESNLNGANYSFSTSSNSSLNLLQQQYRCDSESITSQLWSRGKKVDVCTDCHVLIVGVIDTNRATVKNQNAAK